MLIVKHVYNYQHLNVSSPSANNKLKSISLKFVSLID